MTPPRPRMILAGVPLLMALTGCSGSANSPVEPSGQSAPATSADGIVTYTVAGYLFPALTVAPGTTLRLVDGDDEAHTVTADDGSFESGAFDKANPGMLNAPNAPGSYEIHCTIHPSMHGTIVVR